MTEQQFTQSLLRSNVNFQKEKLRHVLGITETFSGLAERPADQYVTLKADHLDCLFEQISESIDGVLNYLDHISLHIATPDPITPGLDDSDDIDDEDPQDKVSMQGYIYLPDYDIKRTTTIDGKECARYLIPTSAQR